MVRDTVTDGKRIAQLLASELSGLETRSLSAVTVVDADRDAEPTERGTEAYRVTDGDEPVGTVAIYPAAAEIRLAVDPPWPDEQATPAVATGEGAIRVESGKAVKRAVDAIRRVVAANQSGNETRKN